MSVPSTALLLSITIGLPIVLLALGVFYHARVLARPALVDPLELHVEQMVTTDHTEELLAELQSSMQAVRQQLSQQRQSLSGMLSDADHAPRGGIPAMQSRSGMAAAQPRSGMAGAQPRSGMAEAQPRTRAIASMDIAQGASPLTARIAEAQNADPAAELRSSVGRLVSEGLSDRAIARQLRIGLEEVRMARTRTGSTS